MKKILSFVLVLAMILGSVSMAFAKTELISDVSGLDCEEAVNVLTGLGVIEGYEDGNFYPERTISRAEAVKIIISALGIPVSENGSYVTPFADVAPTKWYAGYVQYAYTLGITDGTSATTFSPDAKVTYDQMIAFTMRALGYSDACLQGTYPACFINKAVGLRLLDGVLTGSDAAPRAAVAQLVYNAIQSPIGTIDDENQWNRSTPADSFLIRLGAEVVGTTDINGKFTPTYKVVTMNDLEDEDILVDLTDKLGAVISWYENEDGQTVAVAEVVTEFVKGKYDSEAGTLGGKKLNLGAGEYAVADYFVIANGEDTTHAAFDADDCDTSTEYTYAVTLKNGKINHIYSEQKWDITSAARLKDDADITNLEADAPYINTVAGTFTFALDDENEVDYSKFILEGVDSIDEIKKNDVVYIYANRSGEITKLSVSDKTAEGEFSKITKNEKGTVKYVVDGTSYSVLAANKGNENNLTTTGAIFTNGNLGKEYKLYLGADGKIVDAKLVSGDSNYAVFLQGYGEGAAETLSSSTENAGVRLYTTKGEVKLYLSDETADKTYNYYDSVASVASAGSIVKYTVNSKNEVTKIELVTNSALNEDVSAKGLAGTKLIDAETVVFVYDADGTTTSATKAKNYSVGTYSTLFGKTVTSSAVFASSDSTVEAMVVSDSTGNVFDYAIIVAQEELKDGDYTATIMLNGEKINVATGSNPGYVAPTKDAPGRASNTIYKLSYAADGKVTFAANADLVTTTAISTSTSTALKVENGFLFDTNDDAHELTDDVLVYVYDISAEKWDTMTTSVLNGAKAPTATVYSDRVLTVNLFDTDDDVDGYDIVIVVRR